MAPLRKSPLGGPWSPWPPCQAATGRSSIGLGAELTKSNIAESNIELPGDEESEDCMQKVEDILTGLDCGVGIDSVDRAHRIGLRKISDDDGKVHRQIIVRFSWFR